MSKSLSYIRAVPDSDEIYVCHWCRHVRKNMMRISLNDEVHVMCRSCCDALALMSHNYFMPFLDVHFDIGREPEQLYYPTITQVRVHCTRMFHECNRKIQAIKDLRSVSGLGLKDSKDQVEVWVYGSVGWMSNRIASDYRSYIRGHLHDVRNAWREILKRGYNKRVVY